MKDRRKAKTFECNIKVKESSSFGGILESEGPLGERFDGIVPEQPDKDETWEKAEADMIQSTVNRLLEKTNKKDTDIDLLLGGDLMNQCTSSAYGLENFDIPYIGLYGACSTFAEGIMTGGMYIEAGCCDNVISCASSNFCTAERQYRFPLSYGAFPQSTAQHTVTGCGAVYLEKTTDTRGVFLTGAMPGIVIDTGLANAANMGAAMSAAAADTILRYLKSTGKKIDDHDLIATGDLGSIGLEMLVDMMKNEGFIDQKGVISDCGIMIYDRDSQDVSCGGSGCGCSASVFCADIFKRLLSGEYKRVLLIGTGAMMSPQALLQGLSIPAVAHLVEFTSRV